MIFSFSVASFIARYHQIEKPEIHTAETRPNSEKDTKGALAQTETVNTQQNEGTFARSYR